VIKNVPPSATISAVHAMDAKFVNDIVAPYDFLVYCL
jgi:hypothetical protein